MRILKIIAWLVGGVVALLAVGITLVVLFFDPNNYKGEIEQLVTQHTGRSLKLDGDLKLSVFPWLAVQVGPAALGNAPGYGDEPMVAINGARLGVRLLPLLHSKVEIDAVELDTPRFVLIANADGSNNWADLAKQNDAEKKDDATSSGKLNASVASVTIKNGSVSYDDRAAKVLTTLHDFNLSTGALESGKPVDLKSSFKLERGADMKLDTELSARITADLDASRYQLDQPAISLLLKGASYPKEGLPVHIKAGSMVADRGAQTAQITALAMDAAGASLTGEIKATQLKDAPQFSGTIKLAQMSLRELVPKFGINLPQTTDAKALTRFSMDSTLAASSKSVSFTGLTLRLDDSTMTGSAGIADFDSKALRFDLAIDRINVDRYLPPAAPETEAKPAATNAAPTPIPVDMIRALNLRGKIAINDATFKNLQLAKLNVGMDAANGKLQLDPLQASLYEGKYHGNVVIDAAGNVPRLNLEQHLDGINFAPILEAMYKTKRLSGKGTLNMKLAGSGANTDAIKRTLGGTLDFSVNNGTVNGFDLWYEIRRARALLKQQAIPARAAGPEQTAFTKLQGSAVVTDGVLSNKDLLAAMQYLKVTGNGSINMVSNAIDYKVDAAVLKIPAEDKMAESTQDIVGLTIPVKITGTIADPKVRPDVEGLIKEKAKQRIDEEKDKVIEKAKEKLQDKLKGLFGG